MDGSGLVRFPGDLDPSAQEYRPCYPAQTPSVIPQPQVFYPYNQLAPPPYASQPPPSIHHEGMYPPAYDHPPLPTRLPPLLTAPTRGLLLSSVPTGVSESTVRKELEVFGDVRAVQMERAQEGIVTVHFYDLRAAHAAMEEIRAQHMQHQNRLRIHYMTSGLYLAGSALAVMDPPPYPPPARGLISGCAVWAQFVIPATNAFPDGHNQGTLVVFNLDSQSSSGDLKELFDSIGPVRELRETPLKKHQRFVEFFDVRDAAKALAEMNGKEIHGKKLMIEFSRSGGQGNRLFSSNRDYHSKRDVKAAPRPPPVSPPSPPPYFSRRTPRRMGPNFPPRACATQGQTSLTKWSSSSSSRHGHGKSSSFESVEASMAGLTVRNVIDERESSEQLRKTAKRPGGSSTNSNCSSSGSRSKQQQRHHQVKNRVFYKGNKKNFDPRFLIKEEAIVVESSCRDTRTTVMIKNIPNKYSQKLLLNMLDNHCTHCNEQIADGDGQPLSSFDFLYLPIDFNNKCNMGYGFVNMTSPEATLRAYKAFHKQHWEVFNSKKVCEVTYARVQGLEALKEHFKNSRFACETEEYLPVAFSPPRDGRRNLTVPLPIVGLCRASSSPKSIAVDRELDDDAVEGGDSDTVSGTGGDQLVNQRNDSSDDDRDHVDHEGGGVVITGSSNGGDIIHGYFHSSNISQ